VRQSNGTCGIACAHTFDRGEWYSCAVHVSRGQSVTHEPAGVDPDTSVCQRRSCEHRPARKAKTILGEVVGPGAFFFLRAAEVALRSTEAALGSAATAPGAAEAALGAAADTALGAAAERQP
jgi:hypothetical protein